MNARFALALLFAAFASAQNASNATTSTTGSNGTNGSNNTSGAFEVASSSFAMSAVAIVAAGYAAL